MMNDEEPGEAAVTDAGPLVLMDVDGVVNLGLFASSRERSRLCYRDGWISRRPDHDPFATRMLMNPAWGPMVRSMRDAGGTLAWASRWRQAANWYVAPLLGLPTELPFVPVSRDPGQLKAWSVVPWTDGRPWAWLEDEESELAMASVLSRGRPCLPVLVDRKTGLTQEHADRVIAWLEELR
jgi:hypothetical protein